MDYLIVLIHIMLSGTFSGLTLGLLGLSKTDLVRASDLGDMRATKVLEVVKDHNLLLVTLLLGNTAVNSSLAMFMPSVVGEGMIALLVSTSLILIFGEIVPASVLSKYALNVGAAVAPAVKVLMKITWVVAKPISWTLDKAVGVDGLVVHTRQELSHIIDSHAKSDESDIDELDRKTIQGVITLSDKKVGDHMSKDTYVIESDRRVTKSLLNEIMDKGYTRIPVVTGFKVDGIINVKKLLGYQPEVGDDITTVKDIITNKNPLVVDAEDKLDDVLSIMLKKGRQHIALVKSYDTFVGIITLEDITEEVYGTEIVDEFDKEVL